MTSLWHIIAETNTFNFVLLAIILLILIQKFDVNKAIESLKEHTIKRIQESEQAKVDAENNLSDANSKVENLDSEISEKLKVAGIRADNVADMIDKVTLRKLQQITTNTKRVVENEGKTLISILSDKTAVNSVETAEKYIRNRLKREPELHDKYIDESIDNLEKVLM